MLLVVLLLLWLTKKKFHILNIVSWNYDGDLKKIYTEAINSGQNDNSKKNQETVGSDE